MNIADILAAKGSKVSTIRPDHLIGELSKRLEEEGQGVMVVSSDGMTLSGIISERDIAYGLHKRRGDLHLIKVGMLMTKNVITCTTETPIQDALRMMSEKHIRHIVVVDDNGQIAGLVSIRDLLEIRFGRIKKRTQELKNATAIH